MATSLGSVLRGCAVGLVAAAGVRAVQTTPVLVEPGARAWRRCVWGATRDGAVGGAILRLPGIARGDVVELRLTSDPRQEPRPALVVIQDDGTAQRRLSEASSGLWLLAPAETPGLRLRIGTPEGPVRLTRIEVRSTQRPSFLPPALVAVATAAVVVWLDSSLFGVCLGLLVAGLATLAHVPLLSWWAVPSPRPSAPLVLALLAIVAAVALGVRAAGLRRFAIGAGLVAAAVFGTWVRAYFLPAPGGWDTDYWKACTARVVAHGVTRAYGDPDTIPAGHFWRQLRGQEPLWEATWFGRTFVVDQPPGIMLLWKGSGWAVSHIGGLSASEAETVAAKLPPLLGDFLAVGVLLWAFRGEALRGATLAAVYWALPISWLSSSVLGFFDGAFVALAVAALVLAGRGRATAAGSALALAALVKATALLVAPAVAAALWGARASLRRATGAGVAVVSLALLPFALAGTLPAAVAHCYRIIFQRRFSGGFANPWWLVSHALSLGRDGRSASDPVPFVHIQTLAPLPVNALGVAAFLLVAAYVIWSLRCAPGPRAAALAGATLVLAYGMLAIGVHENHPHPFVLALLASGLYTRPLRALAALFLSTYVLNMLALSGLGRFHGLRYMALEPWLPAVAAFRTSPGFDVTLLLAVANTLGFALLLAWLPRELQAAAALSPTAAPAE